MRVAAGAGVGYSLTLIFVAMLQTRNNCTDCESEAESKMYVCPFWKGDMQCYNLFIFHQFWSILNGISGNSLNLFWNSKKYNQKINLGI